MSPVVHDRFVPVADREWARPRADLLLHHLVEAQADRTPTRRAVSLGDRHLTYRELDTRANQLAHLLVDRGVRAETPVAIVMAQAPAAIVAILAVLKAGGAYTPIDPDYPSERVRLLLADAGAELTITQGTLLPRLPTLPNVLLVDDERDRVCAQPSGRPPGTAHPDGLAYTIYTSGSTGRPKGVMITHRGVVNATTARGAFYRTDPSRFLLLSSLAFDSSIAGIFWTLASGGRLVIPPPAVRRDPYLLVRHIAATRPSHLLCVPSLYRVLTHADTADLSSLRLCVLAGEEWPAELYERHRAALPDTLLANEYGATEVSVWSTGLVCPDGPLDGPPTVGTPIAGATMHVLDRDLAPVPPGETGEVYLGGTGVARGYRGSPMTTAARFVPDPFTALPGARMYRTGDLARRTPGSAHFLGRIDEQTKIRGHRVELGEIRARLCAQPEIEDAVVVVRDAARLVGYVVLEDGVAAEPLVGELRGRLAEHLPAAMVPHAVVAIPEMPLTPNGKIDREALPAPPSTGGTPYAAPVDDVERLVADVVAEVLDVPRVGREDNFFALGGDSVHAMDVSLRLRRRGLGVTAQHVLTCPTVAELAQRAGRATSTPHQETRAAQVGDATVNRLLDRIR